MADRKIRMRAKLKGDETTVKALLDHPMETGLRKDDSGNPIPAHFIQRVLATHNDRRVFEAFWGTGISRNPFVSFTFFGAAKGDTVEVSWVDNRGGSGSGTTNVR